jgi:hypothetical protein
VAVVFQNSEAKTCNRALVSGVSTPLSQILRIRQLGFVLAEYLLQPMLNLQTSRGYRRLEFADVGSIKATY